ncbi:MAG: hypothetical protein ACOYEB_07810 [Enterococcus lemanii]|jgi:hypothetical protein
MKMSGFISLRELVNLTDDDIRKRNPDEADDYIKVRDKLKEEQLSKASVTPLESDVVPKIAKPVRPKRKCTEKQLAALAAGRAKRAEMLREKAAAKAAASENKS